MSWDTIMGRMTPPMLDPATMMPKARARRRANHVPAAARAVFHVSQVIRSLIGACERTREEEKTTSYRTTHALRQEELVVLLGYRSHHQTKHVHKGAEENGEAGAICVRYHACYWALRTMLIREVYGVGGVHTQKNIMNDSVDGIHATVLGG
jgi:hypothetical protein